MPSPDEIGRDRRVLIKMLTTIERQLSLIVHDPQQRARFQPEFQEFFPGPWEEVAASFERSRELLESEDLNWEDVEGIGLTGRMLDWKQRFLDATVGGGGISRFLKIANSFLGSLSKVLPPLEAVKEYKEFVEAGLRSLRG
jgi:hypothetical protein